MERSKSRTSESAVGRDYFVAIRRVMLLAVGSALGLFGSLGTTMAQPIASSPYYFAGAAFSENLANASIYAYDEGAVCGIFSKGDARVPSFFAGLGLPTGLFGTNGWLKAKLGYQDLSTNFTTPADQTGNSPKAYRPSDGALVPIERERSFEAKLGLLGISALYELPVFGSLTTEAGLFGGVLLRKSYSESERIVSPATVVYAENSLTYRQIGQGPLDVHVFQAGLELGISYRLPFQPRLSIEPGVQAMVPFTSISPRSSTAWRVVPIGVSLTLRFEAPASVEEQGTVPAPMPIATWDSLIMNLEEQNHAEAPKKAVLQASIKAFGVTDAGEEIEEPVLSVDRMHVTEVYPMLHYVFFDDGSATIPTRYQQLDRNGTAAFDEKSLYTSNALDIHHHVLDILGKRLKEEPRYSVTIVGSRSIHSPQDSVAGTSVASSRAEAIAKYLREVWGVSSNRLRVRSRDLPDAASDDRNPFGQAENRRVEIVPSSPEVTRPLWTERIEKVATPPHISFDSRITAGAGVKSATIVVRQRERVLQTFDALTGGSVGEYIWTLDSKSMPERRDSLTYTFTVVDSLGDTATSSGVIHLRQEVRDWTKHEADTTLDKELQRYSLLLFEYSSAQLEQKESERITADIAKAIEPSSQVTLTGHTDRTGDEAYNDRLAQRRANEAAAMLDAQLTALRKERPSLQVESHGARELLFDNSLPEGRMLSRTVRVLIQNDTKE